MRVKLLEILSLKGTIVTVDALNCQREIPSSGYSNGFAVRTLASLARKIVGQGGDNALALKANQGTLHDDVVRFHWSIENRLHWRRDVTMNEDQHRTRLDNGPHNLAVLRHMALNVMQKDAAKGSLRGKFMRAGWDDRYLTRLLALF